MVHQAPVNNPNSSLLCEVPISNQPQRPPDDSRIDRKANETYFTSRAGQPGRIRRQNHAQQGYVKYSPARRGWRVALNWQWSTKKCHDCGKVRYRWRTLRWSYSRKRPDGTRETYSKPVKLNELRKGTKVPQPGPAPVIKCACPGKRGPRPSILGPK
jgi:hypothetical protein